MNLQLMTLNSSLQRVAYFSVFSGFNDFEMSNKNVLKDLGKLETSFVALEGYRSNIANVYSEDVVITAITLSTEILRQYAELISFTKSYELGLHNDNELNEHIENVDKLLKNIRNFIDDCNDPNNVVKYQNSDVDEVKKEEV